MCLQITKITLKLSQKYRLLDYYVIKTGLALEDNACKSSSLFAGQDHISTVLPSKRYWLFNHYHCSAGTDHTL